MPGPLFIDGDGVELRTIEREDLDFCRRTLNDPTVRPGLAATDPLTSSAEEEWYERHVVEGDDVHLLVCDDGEPVGTVGLNGVNETFGNAELGYWIAPDYHRNGYATAAARALVDYAFTERRLHKVYANAFAFNEGSQRVLQKVGFEREGVHREQAFVDGEYVDVYRYGLLAPDHTAP
ncbi:GNAT family N-acetyltransferase [Halomicrobium sp. HM KBTZ05]|uniref:GNAT family N-acetyltransferase n=1 Tax=Halomicrobium mukohataei TaxID=57705 RepID=A0A847UJ40_9EURY|nr:GNAT family protein [Halomicrobium mukohataei]NLV11401.1 GNAT family N-acetyltransferase [Halomicrobium mukohataei]